MANLYLLDKAIGQNGLPIAAQDKGAKVVLIQDGVYLNTGPLQRAGVEVYAVAQDLKKRGLDNGLGSQVKVIDYSQLVDLILTNKVVNFS
ncbi:MAG: DsrH/TusB family sulfur metabolism protein [Dehalococcoidia bacterium]|nr:DsrH/TusB family sulfur metabolism protein [Dehalococcoidia bacterium]